MASLGHGVAFIKAVSITYMVTAYIVMAYVVMAYVVGAFCQISQPSPKPQNISERDPVCQVLRHTLSLPIAWLYGYGS